MDLCVRGCTARAARMDGRRTQYHLRQIPASGRQRRDGPRAAATVHVSRLSLPCTGRLVARSGGRAARLPRDGLFGCAPVPHSDRSRRLPTGAGLVLEFLSSCRSRTGSRRHRGPVPARHVPGAPGASRRGDTNRHGRVRIRSAGDGIRSGTQASALTVARNTLGGARLDQAADARGRSVHVRRSAPGGDLRGTTVIAGYPWFSDWGRDTMIALPGLALATGRTQAAAAILRTFAAHVSEGMLPNRFPDGGEEPEYNTVDATLWYFHAVAAYLAATDDKALRRDLCPALRDIIDWHRRGTRYGIRVDPQDGLLFAGEPGVQLTWMDAKVGDWVVTPRIGKPVEINALWHYALTQMAGWGQALKDRRAAADYEAAAARVAISFATRFWYPEGGYLYDVIDGPDGVLDIEGRRVDASLRPNQIFAVSLGTSLLDPVHARAVVDVCAAELLTPVGLRSLAPSDPHYAGHYMGDSRQRDGTYHQGTVWSWLLGPFALAHHAVYGDPEQALALLEGLANHLDEGCIGSVSEIMDGDAPHAPRGCFAP